MDNIEIIAQEENVEKKRVRITEQQPVIIETSVEEVQAQINNLISNRETSIAHFNSEIAKLEERKATILVALGE